MFKDKIPREVLFKHKSGSADGGVGGPLSVIPCNPSTSANDGAAPPALVYSPTSHIADIGVGVGDSEFEYKYFKGMEAVKTILGLNVFRSDILVIRKEYEQILELINTQVESDRAAIGLVLTGHPGIGSCER